MIGYFAPGVQSQNAFGSKQRAEASNVGVALRASAMARLPSAVLGNLAHGRASEEPPPRCARFLKSMNGRLGFLIAAAMAAMAACQQQPEPAAYSGMVITPPRGKPDFTFTSTTGAPYQFRKETDGRVTLLFFGYTYCPDVCPMHMANISAVLKKLDYADRQRVRVVFVTTDPDRDTPQRLRSWLDQIDTSIVGVAGSMDQINALQQSLGLGSAKPEAAPPGSPTSRSPAPPARHTSSARRPMVG